MDVVRAVGFQLYANEVKTEDAFASTIGPHEVARGLAEAMAFAGRQRRFGQFVTVGRACFHFDEHQRLAVFGDEINFAVAAAVIALHDAQAVGAQILSRQPFAQRAGAVVGRARWRARGR